MGVPGLFSWVRRNFAEVIISDAAWSASHPPVSSLFIDLNHILHAATHPDYPFHEPASREEMLEAVLKYIDAILELVQPTELCFVAVDGPPPRAKINQQRSRRFLAAIESGDRARMQEQARTSLGRLLIAPAEPEAKAPAWQAPQAWTCATCTLDNGGGVRLCEACGSARPEEAWSCGLCTLLNAAGSEQCAACATPRRASSTKAASTTVEAQAAALLPAAPHPFDSNELTPGTELMQWLCGAVEAGLQQRVASEPRWRQLLVVFSPEAEPGSAAQTPAGWGGGDRVRRGL